MKGRGASLFVLCDGGEGRGGEGGGVVVEEEEVVLAAAAATAAVAMAVNLIPEDGRKMYSCPAMSHTRPWTFMK